MTIQKIKEEIEKIKTLIELQNKLFEDVNQGDTSFLIKQKIIVTRDELLKSNYKIGKSLKELEEKV